MIRLSWKKGRLDTLVPNKPLVLNDQPYKAVINPETFSYVISRNGTILVNETGTSLISAKKSIKVKLIELGFTFDSEKRIRVKTQEAA